MKEEKINALEKLKKARAIDRPSGNCFISNLFHDFIELHGDKCFSDDKAIIGGIGWLFDIPVTVIAHEKGKNINERIKRNFAQAHPEGYRKAFRLMKQAEKFNRPIITFVDTPGAFPGVEAEEHGQGYTIAQILKLSISLKTPIISVFIGEGGSGGALALAVADEIWMLENAVFSVISPEGCASILFKDIKYTEHAAQSLKITAKDLYNYKIIDKIIRENQNMFSLLKENLYKKLLELKEMDKEELIKKRFDKFMNIPNEDVVKNLKKQS